MHPMEEAKEPAVVHEAVGPIEVGVVQEDRANDAEPEPSAAMGAEVEVHPRPAVARGDGGDGANQTEDDEGERRIADLPPDLGGFRQPRRMIFRRSQRLLENHVAKKPRGARM